MKKSESEKIWAKNKKLNEKLMTNGGIQSAYDLLKIPFLEEEYPEIVECFCCGKKDFRTSMLQASDNDGDLIDEWAHKKCVELHFSKETIISLEKHEYN